MAYRIMYGNSPIHNSVDVSAYHASLSGTSDDYSVLRFTIAPSHPMFSKIKIRDFDNLVTLSYDDQLLFMGHVQTKSVGITGEMTVTCWECLSWYRDMCYHIEYQKLKPAWYGPVYMIKNFNEMAKVKLENVHTQEYGDTFTTVYGTTWTNAMAVEDSVTDGTVFDLISHYAIDRHDMKWWIDYSANPPHVDIIKNYPVTNSQTITFGVNLTSLEYEETYDGVYNAVMPIGPVPENKTGIQSYTWQTDQVEVRKPARTLSLYDGAPDQPTHSRKLLEGDYYQFGNIIFHEPSVRKYGLSCKVIQNDQLKYDGGTIDGSTISRVASLVKGTQLDTNNTVAKGIAYSITTNTELTSVSIFVKNNPSDSVVCSGNTTVKWTPKTGGTISLLSNDGDGSFTYTIKEPGARHYIREWGLSECKKLNKEPRKSISVNAVDMAFTSSSYKHLRCCEYVRVISTPHGIDEVLPVTAVDLNLDDPSQTRYTIGAQMRTLTNALGMTNSSIIGLGAK